MKQNLELYLVTLWNDNKIVVSIKPSDYTNMGIGDKRRKIAKDLNDNFQIVDFVKFVKFYGYADVDVKDQIFNNRR